MKKYFLVFGFTVLIEILFIRFGYADGYLVLTGGFHGKTGSLPDIGEIGENNAFSFGGEVGWNGKHLLLGIGMADIFSKTDYILTYREPNVKDPFYRYAKHIDEFEAFGVIGINITKGFTFISTAGYSGEIIQTKTGGNSIGYMEWPSEDGNGHFSFSGRLQFEIKRFILDIGIHNRRGVIIGMGYTWTIQRKKVIDL